MLAYRNLTVSFGDAPVLDAAQFSLEARERVCLLGRNGEGKSTLLRVIRGELQPDSGELEQSRELRVAKLDQELPASQEGTVFDCVAEGLGEAQALLSSYHQTAQQLAETPEDRALEARLDALHAELDSSGGWALEQQVLSAISRVELEPQTRFATLSGGRKRRVLLARALVLDPHLLLLDEPTNHLDLESIHWLETFLLRYDRALLFVTHDRAFMRRVATRILDLDRGKLTSYDCNYETYLERKAEAIEAEAKQRAVFDKKLAQEEVWVRQGIKARRTRNEGRVRALEKLRLERARRREQQGVASLDMQQAELSGSKVIKTENLSYHWGERCIVQGLTTTIWRGDKIGIIGANGSGKTTLLQLLLGRLPPDAGTLKHGTKLEVAYFDQHREQLDEDRTLAENVSPHSDTVTVNGKSRHILSYLKDFLFSAETARAPIRRLSGGERARLLLARLFLKPANVLVMDEPTNDLDIQTVELLEDLLLQYAGTLLLVSHDRDFLSNVVNASFVLDGSGQVREYVGACFPDNKSQSTAADAFQKKVSRPESTDSSSSRSPSSKRKLSNKEREALRTLPEKIEQMEASHRAFAEAIARPDYYSQSGETPAEAAAKLAEMEAEIERTYAAWEAVEARAAELEA